jgi:hypothetical protein
MDQLWKRFFGLGLEIETLAKMDALTPLKVASDKELRGCPGDCKDGRSAPKEVVALAWSILAEVICGF